MSRWTRSLWRCIAVPLFMLALAGPAGALAAPRPGYQAKVSSVVDGDTLWVRRSAGSAGIEIRLQGLDAPESCQRWGREAREALRRRVLARTVTVVEVGRDSYGRVLARLHGDGQDVGAWLVANGHAWSARFHGKPGPYAQQEVTAREAGRGLWSQRRPVEPRTFRRQHGPCPH